MKKLLFVLLLGAFVACNNSSTTETTGDSTATAIDSSANASIDSVKEVKDSLVNKIDSTADAKTDSIKK